MRLRRWWRGAMKGYGKFEFVGLHTVDDIRPDCVDGMRMGHGRRAGHRVRQMMKKMARKRQKSELRKELSVYR